MMLSKTIFFSSNFFSRIMCLYKTQKLLKKLYCQLFNSTLKYIKEYNHDLPQKDNKHLNYQTVYFYYL